MVARAYVAPQTLTTSRGRLGDGRPRAGTSTKMSSTRAKTLVVVRASGEDVVFQSSKKVRIFKIRSFFKKSKQKYPANTRSKGELRDGLGLKSSREE